MDYSLILRGYERSSLVGLPLQKHSRKVSDLVMMYKTLIIRSINQINFFGVC